MLSNDCEHARTPLRVIDLTEFYSVRGGVRCHLNAKSDVLSRTGHEHWVVAPGPDEIQQQALPSSISVKSVKLLRVGGPALPYDSNYHLMWRPDRVKALLERARPDVLEVNSPYVAMLVARGLRASHVGIRTFYWHADFVDTYLRPRLPSGSGPLGALGTRIIARAWDWVREWLTPCDAIFTSTEEQAERLRTHGLRRVVPVRAGVDHRTFCPAARSEALRSRLVGERPNALLLVAAGRLAGEKRWDVVIDAFSAFRKRRDAVLVVFGDGPERPALERRASACNDVIFAGFEKEPARLAAAFATADALVHGSPYETFGLAVAQAAACGTPLVVPDQGGAAALVDPTCGVSYASLDAAACSAALNRLFDTRTFGEASALRERAVSAARRIPDTTTQFTHMIQVYQELLARRASWRAATRSEAA
jgi:alpha-1,6-mannosyltransferase